MSRASRSSPAGAYAGASPMATQLWPVCFHNGSNTAIALGVLAVQLIGESEFPLRDRMIPDRAGPPRAPETRLREPADGREREREHHRRVARERIGLKRTPGFGQTLVEATDAPLEKKETEPAAGLHVLRMSARASRNSFPAFLKSRSQSSAATASALWASAETGSATVARVAASRAAGIMSYRTAKPL